MRHYEDRIIPQRTEKTQIRATCDICSKEIRTSGYATDDVIIEHRKGVSYPDCTDIDVFSFDICPGCWETKLVPFLESFGSKSTKRNIEF